MIANFSANEYNPYRIGVPERGNYRSLMHSNNTHEEGTASQSSPSYSSQPIAWHGHNQSISLQLPPFTFMLLTLDPGDTH
ncbi:alpha amylase C-terminal domain-containing protein [Paenibacillus sp. MCAF20]